jgi:hypothetical protein
MTIFEYELKLNKSNNTGSLKLLTINGDKSTSPNFYKMSLDSSDIVTVHDIINPANASDQNNSSDEIAITILVLITLNGDKSIKIYKINNDIINDQKLEIVIEKNNNETDELDNLIVGLIDKMNKPQSKQDVAKEIPQNNGKSKYSFFKRLFRIKGGGTLKSHKLNHKIKRTQKKRTKHDIG